MFVLSQSKSYAWPVTVSLPASGGRFEKHSFDAEFKRIPQTRILEIGKQIKAGETSDVDLCRELLVGWKGIQDPNGEEMPFSESARDMLLDVHLVAAAIVEAFFNSIAGAKAKN